MTTVSQPDVTLNILAANTQVANTDQKVLFIGQKTSAGTAVSGALNTDIANDNSWDTLFGKTSMLAKSVRDARRMNQDVRFDAIALDDSGTGVDATGTFAISGTATEDGSLTFIVGSKQNHSYKVAVTSSDTATEIGDALVLKIAADSNVIVTSANVTGTVTLTNVNAGTVGNTIGMKVEGSVAGITVAVTGMASGANDPTLTNVFDIIGEERYQTIVWPYDQDVDTVKNFLDARFNTSNDVQDGVAIIGVADTVSNLNSTLTAINSQSLAMNVDEQVSTSIFRGPALLEIGYSKSSQFAAVRSLRLQDGTDISQFVITREGARDSFGGPALASKPYFSTPFPYFPSIDIGDGFSRQETETLHDNGGFVFGNNTAGNATIAGEVVTTYKTDSAGNPDVSFRYLNYVDTISNIREYYFNNLKSRFAQSRLTEGDLVRGRDMANQELIESYCTQLYDELSGEDFVLTQSGEDSLKFYNNNLVVDIDIETGTVTINMKTLIVTQLRTIQGTIQIAFSTNG